MKFIQQFVRFAGIGFLNTAVDFAVFNFVASTFHIYSGARVGLINTVSFSVAVLHSYFWNKYWAFASDAQETRFLKNLGQFVGAAILGAAVIAGAVFGAKAQYGPLYNLFLLAVMAAGELGLWKFFHLKKGRSKRDSHKDLLLFVVIALVGVFINSGIVAGVTALVPPLFGINQELWTNLIKAGATGIVLIWNFLGFKLFVFKE